jgi:hypothetical protein
MVVGLAIAFTLCGYRNATTGLPVLSFSSEVGDEGVYKKLLHF